MANLRGGSFEKQIKDAFHRLLKAKESRHMTDTNFTHSRALGAKREMYLRDFKEYLEKNGIKEGKLNNFMDKQTLNKFVQERIKDLAPKTRIDYISGFNSLIQGLQQANVTIPTASKDVFKDLREQTKVELKAQEIIKGREIKNIDEKISKLERISKESSVIAKLQAQTGLRVSEALEVAKNIDKYYDKTNSTLTGVKGKGNHLYKDIKISKVLAKELKQIKEVPSYKNYSKNLKEVGINRSHNFRVTYAKNSYIEKLEKGLSHKEALKEVSEEINHHRESMTEYYLNRA